MEANSIRACLGVEFDETLMAIACKHNSMFADSPKNAAINGNLHSVGKYALSAATMISAFRSDKSITASNLLAVANAKKRLFYKAFFLKYDLRPYFIVHKNLDSESVEDAILNQIIGAVFISNEPLITLNLLLSILDKIKVGAEIDYRTAVHEFASNRKIPFSYEIIDERGADNDKTFVAQLSFGTEKFIAEGKSKKGAYASAAEKCVSAKRIPTRKKQDTLPLPNREYSLDENRIKSLNSIIEILNIDAGLLTLREIDSAFTHPSYANGVNNRQLAVRNSVLREIGAHLLIASACKLLFDPESTDILTRQISEIVAGEAIRQATDKRLLPYIRVISNSTEEMNGILYECYKALLAVVFLKYINLQSPDLLETYHTLCRNLLNDAKQFAFIDFTTRLQEMAQEVGSKVEYRQIEVTSNQENNTFSYLIEATYSSDEQIVRSTGRGKNIKSARNDASRNLIQLILNEQKEDDSVQKQYGTEKEGSKAIAAQSSTQIPSAPKKPPQESNSNQADSPAVVYTETRRQFKRSREVASYVKICAEGICELCKQPAPFLDLSGRPYLECHHVIWLSKGGSDTVMNAVALCPTCHRKIHVLNNQADLDILLAAVAKHKYYFQ